MSHRKFTVQDSRSYQGFPSGQISGGGGVEGSTQFSARGPSARTQSPAPAASHSAMAFGVWPVDPLLWIATRCEWFSTQNRAEKANRSQQIQW